MAEVGNWVGELTTTQGTGSLDLGGPLSGFAPFSVLGGDGTQVWYAIIDGFDREAGIGTLVGGTLQRTTVYASLVNGVYSDNGTSPISLSGNAEVYCTFNKTAFEEFSNKIDSDNPIANGPLLLADGVAANPALGFTNDPDTGFYFDSTDTVFVHSGNPIFRYTSTGLDLWDTGGLQYVRVLDFRDYPDLQQYVTDAETAANLAQSSATAADLSEQAAALSETNAATSASNALTSETNAATSETNAGNSASSASTSASNASTSEANALASENKAQEWAENPEDVEVEPSKFSALHWASKAEASAESIGINVKETIPLSSGQTTVSFSSFSDIAEAALYLIGDDADQGRLVEGIDYTVTNPSTIELTESQPAGSNITAYRAVEGEAPEVNFNANRNLIINGDMSVWQRGTSFSVTSTSARYSSDRWSDTPFGNFSRDADQIAGLIHEFALRITANNAGTYVVGQLVEGAQALENKQVTATFKVLIPATAANCSIRAFDGNSGSGSAGIQSVSFTPTGALQTVTATFTLGTHLDATDGWNFQVKADLAISEVIEIHEAQVEFGQVATDFEYVDPATQLARCQRYYFRHEGGEFQVTGRVRFASESRAWFAFPSEMRVTPSIETSGIPTDYTVEEGTNSFDCNGTPSLIAGSSSKGANLSFGVAGTLTAGQATAVTGKASGFLGFDAEL